MTNILTIIDAPLRLFIGLIFFGAIIWAVEALIRRRQADPIPFHQDRWNITCRACFWSSSGPDKNELVRRYAKHERFHRDR